MAKYSYELKKKIVEEYLSGKTSYRDLESKYHVGNSQILKWVNNYKHFGDEGLMRSRNKRAYSVEFKIKDITRYGTSECSYQRLPLPPHLSLRSWLELPNDRLSSHAERTPHLPKHVEKRQLLRQRTHGKLLQRPEKRNLCRPRLPKPARTGPSHRTLYPLLQQRPNQRKVRRFKSERVP